MRTPTHLVSDLTIIVVILMSVALAGCGDTPTTEGPAERAGKATDKAVEKTGDAIKEGARKTGEGVERVGEKIQEKTSP